MIQKLRNSVKKGVKSAEKVDGVNFFITPEKSRLLGGAGENALLDLNVTFFF